MRRAAAIIGATRITSAGACRRRNCSAMKRIYGSMCANISL